MKAVIYLKKNRKTILGTTFMFLIISLVISAFTFPSRFADKGSIAGCDITISATNGSATETITMTHIEFKVKGGWWAVILNSPPPIAPGSGVNTTLHGLFNCDVNRRYRFKLKRGNVSLPDYCYVPSEDGWTTDPNANFGDLNRHF